MSTQPVTTGSAGDIAVPTAAEVSVVADTKSAPAAAATTATGGTGVGAHVYEQADPLSIRFTQKQSAKKFVDGRSVVEAIVALRAGTLAPDAFPPIRCVRVPPQSPSPSSQSHGAEKEEAGAGAGAGASSLSSSSGPLWSLDNRRLFALQTYAKSRAPVWGHVHSRMCGLKQVPG
jgi:hypothetical protein